MNGFWVGIALALSALILLYLYRVLLGPTVYDRVLGLYGISTKVIVLLILVGVLYGRMDMYVDIGLGYGLMNLVGSLAAAKYLEEQGRT